MHDQWVDRTGRLYRNLDALIDNEATVGEDRLFDNSGKLYRDLASRMDDEVTVGEDCEYEPEDRTGKSYIAVGKEVSVDKDVLIGPEDRKSSIGIGAKEAAETYKVVNNIMDFGTNGYTGKPWIDLDGDMKDLPVDRSYKSLNPNENVEEDYYSVVGRMKDIYASKNSDYGNSFEMTLDKYGIIGAIIRMQDKMNRIDGYYWKPDDEKKVDESLIDTLEDLGNYAIMTSVWLRNQ